MFLLDDLLLAVVIAVFLLLATTLTSSILCFFGLLISCGGKSEIFGGANKSKPPKTANADSINADLVSIDKFKNNVDVLLKTNIGTHQKFSILMQQLETYGYTKPDADYMQVQDARMETAKAIYKREKVDTKIFDIDYEKITGVYLSMTTNEIKDDKTMTKSVINKIMHYRTLQEDYPTTTATAYNNWNINVIEYNPIDKVQYDETLKKIYEYAIISSIRSLKSNEDKELDSLISKFQLGELTHPKMKLIFNDKTTQDIYHCKSYQIKKPHSDKYKKLHWGQRKLLLSEIDFFNRVASDIGYDKFKKQNISLVYPGAAHGHHLLIELEMYPTLVLYLWDPARYNKVLYLAEFLRRKMPIPYEYSDNHMEMAKKYVGRVFINMELSNDIFLTYWTNSTTGNIHKNFGPEYGFFTKKSAEYFLKYKKEHKDTSPTLFVSDIRLFTKSEATNALVFNKIKDYHDSIALLLINEQIRHSDYVRDMKLQEDWLEFVNAQYGLFKFKLKTKGYVNEQNIQYKYPDGEIILQAWAPVASTETRLFVKPSRAPAYYNIQKYTDKLKTFNLIMRTHDMSDIKLKDLNIKVYGNSDATLEDIWSHVLDNNLIGQDAILETHILYDYLTIYKKPEDIKHTDLILMISDITQACLDPFDQSGILGYFNDSDVDGIINSRYNYHNSFSRRLDFNSIFGDKFICAIKRPHELKNQKNYTKDKNY